MELEKSQAELQAWVFEYFRLPSTNEPHFLNPKKPFASTPWKINGWNLKMMVWKMIFLSIG